MKPTPTDHRVNWAKSNEDFPTWTDTGGNAFPPGTSYTISGLDEGVEYKVHVRARYSGESAGPWSAKVRIVVASQPAQNEDDQVSGDSDQEPPSQDNQGTNQNEEEEQQTPDREIGGLTLSSDAPGTIQVSWDEVSPRPTDHHVNWGKTSDDFAPHTSSDGNAYPASNFYTISGLDEGVEYKVHVRARYSGESAGPWSPTAMITVSSQPEPVEPVPDEPPLLPGDDEEVVYLGVLNSYERARYDPHELGGSEDDRLWFSFVVSGQGDAGPALKADLGLRQLDADADLILRDKQGNRVPARQEQWRGQRRNQRGPPQQRVRRRQVLPGGASP